LSPPPIRRARPPASKTPGIAGASLDVASFVTVFALALVVPQEGTIRGTGVPSIYIIVAG
jgi:hypothetical protein